MFLTAGKDLEAAVKAIDAALADSANTGFKTQLEREKQQARFDIAINIFNQARTLPRQGKRRCQRSPRHTMAKAKTAFLALRSDESSQVGWLANAWLMKCSMEMTIPDDVKKYHDFIEKRKADKNANPPFSRHCVWFATSRFRTKRRLRFERDRRRRRPQRQAKAKPPPTLAHRPGRRRRLVESVSQLSQNL